MDVSALMTRETVSCGTDVSLATPAKLMWDADCGAVPVVDERGVVQGMITDRDICMACFTQNNPPSAIPVKDAMSRTLYTCSPESTIAEAEEIMRNNRVRRVPVVGPEGQLVGMLSLADIARASDRRGKWPNKALEPESVLQVLEAICEPIQTSTPSRPSA